MVDVALHGDKKVVQGFVMPKGALHCQLGIQVILQCMFMVSSGNLTRLSCVGAVAYACLSIDPFMLNSSWVSLA